MSDRLRLPALLLLVLTAGPAAAAITATVEVIADDGTPVPGGSGTFASFAVPAIEDGQIAFNGGNALYTPGIYGWQAGTLTKVADQSDASPGGSAAFGLPQVAGSDIWFSGSLSDSSGQESVVRYGNGQLNAVLDETNTIPGLPAVPAPEYWHVAARGSAVFVQVSQIGVSLFRVAPNGPAPVAEFGAPAPGGGTFGSIEQPVTNGTQVSFIAGLQGEPQESRRLYLADGATLTVVAEPGTTLPNGQLEKLSNDRQAHGGSVVAFIAKPIGLPESIYTWEDGTIRLAVEGTDSPGDNGPLDVLGDLAVSADGDLAFVGRYGVYIQSGGQLEEIIDTSSEVDGRRIAGFFIGANALSGKVLTIKAFLEEDGTLALSEAILRIPYTVTGSGGGGSEGGGGGGGGSVLDLYGLALLLGLVMHRQRRRRLHRT